MDGLRNEEVAKRIGHNVFLARRRAGYSQEGLGKRCSLHRTEIGMIESGARLPRSDTLMKRAGGAGSGSGAAAARDRVDTARPGGRRQLRDHLCESEERLTMLVKQKPTGPEDVLPSILQHPLRKRLLRFYVEAEGTLSPKELTLLANDPKISNVGYHVRVLAEKGAAELIETQPRRGSVEHFYEATDLVDEAPWGRAALGAGEGER